MARAWNSSIWKQVEGLLQSLRLTWATSQCLVSRKKILRCSFCLIGTLFSILSVIAKLLTVPSTVRMLCSGNNRNLATWYTSTWYSYFLYMFSVCTLVCWVVIWWFSDCWHLDGQSFFCLSPHTAGYWTSLLPLDYTVLSHVLLYILFYKIISQNSGCLEF